MHTRQHTLDLSILRIIITTQVFLHALYLLIFCFVHYSALSYGRTIHLLFRQLRYQTKIYGSATYACAIRHQFSARLHRYYTVQKTKVNNVFFTLQQLNKSSYTECLGVSHRLLRMYQIRTTTEPSPMSARGTHPHRNARH